MADLSPDWLQSLLGIKLFNVFAGFAGGVVRGLVTKGVSCTHRVTSAIVGGLTAGYVTPAAMPVVHRWFDLWSYPVGEIEGSVGFALGLVGMTACDAALRWAKRWRDGPPPMPPPKSAG